MGADLFIRDRYKKLEKKYEPKFYDAVKKRYEASTEADKEKYQKLVIYYYDKYHAKDVYFRDCYNPSGLMWVLRHNLKDDSYSWWTWNSGKYFFDESGDNLTVEGQEAFLNKMLHARRMLVNSRLEYENGDMMSDEDEFNYRQRLERLIYFMREAIKSGEPLEWSV